jgi:hypothetical protein
VDEQQKQVLLRVLIKLPVTQLLNKVALIHAWNPPMPHASC